MTRLFVLCGHGNGDPGAGGGGKNEADLVRQLAKKMKELGGSDVEVLDTSRNWYADGGVNAALKKKIGSNPLIELHLDAASASAKGGHVIIKDTMQPDKYDKALAEFLKKEFPGRAELIVKRGNLANVNRSATHGINYRLIEVCFITNDADRKKLLGNMGDIAKGILGAFGIGGTSTYVIRKEGLWVWDTYEGGRRKLVQLKKGRRIQVTGTREYGKNLWASFVAKGTGKTRWFKIRSLDGKNVYAVKE